MGKTYNSIEEMILDLSNSDVVPKKFLTLHNKENSFPCKIYQKYARIHLDEYSEQKKLRKEWFETRDWMNFDDDLEKIIDDYYNESDTYFINRWLKRN